MCPVSEKNWKARRADKATGLQRPFKSRSVSVLNGILTGTGILFLKSTDGRAITNTQARGKREKFVPVLNNLTIKNGIDQSDQIVHRGRRNLDLEIAKDTFSGRYCQFRRC